MANFEPKTFNASDINGGKKFKAGDGITPEAINAPIESALLMQELATTHPQYIENGGSPSVTIENGQFVFANLKGEKGEKGEQGVGIPTNMSQNANKTIIVDGSVVNGNWNATFILQQGGKQRPICTQYTNHTGAKAEIVATANSAKFKFVNGSTDPQSYVEIFEDKINFSKPITVQGNPVGSGSSGNSISWMSLMETSGIYWDSSEDYNGYFLIPKGYTSYTFYNSYGYIHLTSTMMTGGTISFSYDGIFGLKILTNPYYDDSGLLQDFYAVRGWNMMYDEYASGMNGTMLKME